MKVIQKVRTAWKKSIPLAGIVLSVAALTLSVLWFITTLDFEPAITTIGIAAAIVTFFIDPWLERRSLREELLKSMIVEIHLNIMLFSHNKFSPQLEHMHDLEIYPRLVYSALDRAVSSGLFNEDKDSKLRGCAMNTRIKAEYFNQWLSIIEITHIFRDPQSRMTYHNSIKQSPAFSTAETQYADLIMIIATDYLEEANLEMHKDEFEIALHPEGHKSSE